MISHQFLTNSSTVIDSPFGTNSVLALPWLQELSVPDFALFAESVVLLNPLDQFAYAWISLLEEELLGSWIMDQESGSQLLIRIMDPGYGSISRIMDQKVHFVLFNPQDNWFLTSRGPLRKSLQVSTSFFPTMQDSHVYDHWSWSEYYHYMNSMLNCKIDGTGGIFFLKIHSRPRVTLPHPSLGQLVLTHYPTLMNSGSGL